MRIRRKINKEEGQLLLEILVVIGVTAVILVLGSQFIFLSLRSNKVSNEKNIALGLVEETFEAVRGAVTERWQNVYELTHASDYYPTTSSGKWVISTAGTENVVLNNTTFVRSFQVRHVCRDNSTRHITGITDSDGTLQTCGTSGGSADPSTQKVTVTISWPNADALVTSEYLAGRWRNKVCNQTGWSTTGGTSGEVACPSTGWDTKTNIDTTAAGNTEIKLCDGC
jgi:type II secretory pathway pseudopilin PulG